MPRVKINMIRKHITIDEDDYKKWGKYAEKLGISISELIRRGTNILISIFEIIELNNCDSAMTKVQSIDLMVAIVDYYGDKLCK